MSRQDVCRFLEDGKSISLTTLSEDIYTILTSPIVLQELHSVRQQLAAEQSRSFRLEVISLAFSRMTWVGVKSWEEQETFLSTRMSYLESNSSEPLLCT